MTTYARIVNGRTADIVVTPPSLESRYHPDWLARNTFIVVPDGTLDNARDNGDGTYSNPVPAQQPIPQPNNPGNPYFGKAPLATKDFWALVGQVLPADRMKRLLNDSHFIWVDKVLGEITLVDPDDKAGQFLQIVAYLVGTAGDDGQPLMTKTERDTIMSAWK